MFAHTYKLHKIIQMRKIADNLLQLHQIFFNIYTCSKFIYNFSDSIQIKMFRSASYHCHLTTYMYTFNYDYLEI